MYELCQVHSGRITLTAEVDSIYTLTTLHTGQKGVAGKIPLPADFPLPYKDDFDGSLTLTSVYWLRLIACLSVLSVDTQCVCEVLP